MYVGNGQLYPKASYFSMYNHQPPNLKMVSPPLSVSITADEMTNVHVRDHSILNVIASVQGKPYLIGVMKIEVCNQSTFSQAIISSVSEAGIAFQNVILQYFGQCCMLQEGIQ